MRLPDVVGLAEAAEILQVRPPNVRKMLERRGLDPLELKAGPIWNRRDVQRAKDKHDRDEAARAADAQRRATARANAAT